MHRLVVLELRVGRVGSIGAPGREEPSAIGKTRAAGRLALGPDGFAGDTVADRKHHGGPDKAVCVYPSSRYECWRDRYGTPLPRPAFGENLLVGGADEDDARVGDVYRIGTALVQVSQPRVPCHKPAAFTGEARLTLDLRATGWTGWYLRVLEGGEVGEGDALVLVERDAAAWSVLRLNLARYVSTDPLEARSAAASPGLTESWRRGLRERAAKLERSAP
jgi:MOSC domain-containing protein YiiM